MMFKCKYKKAFDFNLFMINSKFHSDVADLLRHRDHQDILDMRAKLTPIDAHTFDHLYDDGASIDALFAYCVERLQSYYLATRYGRDE